MTQVKDFSNQSIRFWVDMRATGAGHVPKRPDNYAGCEVIMRKLVAFFGTALVLASCATKIDYVFQPPASDEPETRIQFIQYRNVYSWHGESDRLLYVQSRDRQWYRVDLFSPCIGLEYALGVKLLASDSAGTFDRFSSIAIRGQRCKVESVKKVAPPVKTSTPRSARS